MEGWRAYSIKAGKDCFQHAWPFVSMQAATVSTELLSLRGGALCAAGGLHIHVQATVFDRAFEQLLAWIFATAISAMLSIGGCSSS